MLPRRHIRRVGSTAALVLVSGCHALAGSNPALLPECPPEILAVPDNAFGGLSLDAARDSLAGRGVLDPTTAVRVVRATRIPELKNRAEFGRSLDKIYPAELRNSGAGGTTTYGLHLDPSGAAKEVRVLKTSGLFALDQGGAEILREARFSSAVADGCRASIWLQVPITFRVRDYASS
jgi:TonB family protein